MSVNMRSINYTQNSELNRSNIPLNIKYLMDQAEIYILFTSHITKMKILQLRKLLALSKNLNVKLYLIKTFVPKAKYLLKVESVQYIKDKILSIITSICHVDDTIEAIGKDVELVELILRSFDNCNNNFWLQKTLFKLLHLIACKIQSDPNSDWIIHLTDCNYLLGPNIIDILKHLTQDIRIQDNMVSLYPYSSFIEIIGALETLSELSLPDASNILEHLFEIEDLLRALQKWSYTIFGKHVQRTARGLITLTQWFIIEEWLLLMTNITKLNSFKLKSDFDLENDIDRIFCLDDVTVALCLCRICHYETIFIEDFWDYQQFLQRSLQIAINTLYKIIKLSLSSFLGNKTMPRMAEIISDIVDCIKINPFLHLINLNDNGQYVEQYLAHIMRQWKCKEFMELFLIPIVFPLRIENCYSCCTCDRVLQNIITSDVPQHIKDKSYKVYDICWYLRNS